MTFKKRKKKTDQGLSWKARAPRLFVLMSEPTLGSFFILPILYLVLKKWWNKSLNSIESIIVVAGLMS